MTRKDLKELSCGVTESNLYRRPSAVTEEKPVASVRPVQSTPIPMMPRQTSSGSGPNRDPSRSSLEGFPVNCLQKAGVFVQKIVTTTGRQIFLHRFDFFVVSTLPLFVIFYFIVFRYNHSGNKQLQRCPGQDHCRRKHSCHSGHQR